MIDVILLNKTKQDDELDTIEKVQIYRLSNGLLLKKVLQVERDIRKQYVLV